MKAAPATYAISLDSWMGNSPRGNPWGQDPHKPIEDYEPFKYMEGEKYLPYIRDDDGDFDNMVDSVTVKVE